MWFRKIKFKKLQYILLTIILAAASMIFSASLAYVQEVNALIKNYYSEKNMPEMFIAAKDGAYERIISDESLIKDIKSIFYYNGKINSELVKLNDGNLKGEYTVFPITNKNELIYTMELKDANNKATAPKQGEIWIPFTYADQNDIKTGDILTLGDKGAYKVTALTISATTSTVFSKYNPYYISEADYSKFESAKDYEIILINAKNKAEINNVFEQATNIAGGLLEAGSTREGFYASDAMTTNITGNIGIAASLIMFAASLFIVAYIIRSNLQKELKAIGIYKSLGFSNGKIKRIYFTGYLLTGIIAASIGVLAGLPLIFTMSIPAVKYFGTFSITAITAICGIISIASLTAITALSLTLVLRKIDKIKPIETLNMGLRSNTKKLKKSIIKSAHSPFAISLNEIFKYSGSSIMAVIMIAIAVFMSYAFGGIGHSMSFMGEKIGSYFSFPEGDAYIMENNNLYDELKGKQEVKSIIAAKVSFFNMELNNINAGMNVYVQDNFDPKLTGMFYKGREPQTVSEVAINQSFLEQYSLKINEYITIGLPEQESKTYLITGSFSSMVSAANSIQMIDDSLLAKESALEFLSIRLTKGTAFNIFKESAESNYNVFVYKQFPYVDKMADKIYDIVKTPVNIMIALFMVFSILIIVNLLFMNYIDNKKSFGTLKTLGLSTKYITLKNLCKVLILSIVGAVLGLLLGIIIAPILYTGIVGNPAFVFPNSLAFELLGALFLLVSVITLIFAIPIHKIKPKILMEE